MSTHARYLRDMKSQDDKSQAKFDNHGWLKEAVPEVKEEFTSVNYNELVMCPFCLYQAKLSAFFISNKKGISQGMAQCPECKNGMRMKSLWADMSPSEYAKWVFDYSRSGFWKKCPFAIWKKRLKEIGWSTAFWNRYKELKGVESAETIFSDAERMARDYGIDIKEH